MKQRNKLTLNVGNIVMTNANEFDDDSLLDIFNESTDDDVLDIFNESADEELLSIFNEEASDDTFGLSDEDARLLESLNNIMIEDHQPGEASAHDEVIASEELIDDVEEELSGKKNTKHEVPNENRMDPKNTIEDSVEFDDADMDLVNADDDSIIESDSNFLMALLKAEENSFLKKVDTESILNEDGETSNFFS